MSKTCLTAVLHACVKNPKSGLDAKTIADFLKKPYPTFMAELGNDKNHKLDADLLIEIVNMTGCDQALHFIARECGGVYIPIDKGLENTSDELTKNTLNSVKEFGEFLAEIASSIEDGIINQHEYNRIIKEGHEAVTAIMGVLENVRKIHHEQYGDLYFVCLSDKESFRQTNPLRKGRMPERIEDSARGEEKKK